MADLHGGFRCRGRRSNGAAGVRNLEIVNGREFSSGQTYFDPPPPNRPTSIVSSSAHRSGKAKASSSSGSKSSWSFNDPEMKRRKRVAKYKMYAMEGKVKASFRKGFRWIKHKCSELVHGW
ncbi:uncharacterized protein LOC131225720 [Magnolia sinica]|uniref:uncharacterized protein LOC131225720 n=1 Tax=Magnolia sinica TaxID=86752 RepID=UPI00265850A9|nr:uncharacterized protein LOC131225720 [Magnolia sinica]